MSFPLTDTDLAIWLSNFARVFRAHATDLGFTAADVASTYNDAAMFAYLVNVDLPTYEKAFATRVSYKELIKTGPIGARGEELPPSPPVTLPPNQVEPGIVPRLHELVGRIKAAPNYTNELAREFGFDDDESITRTELALAKPSGRAIGQPDSEVRVEFTKSAFDGVLIESRRTGQQEWSRLAIDKFSPYVDSRPLVRGDKPEVREYRMRFLMHDVPVGEWSDILVATASA
jgi:hypothetical protein